MGLELINAIRKQKGLKSEDLSKISGVPIGTLNKILNGQSKKPTFETISAISEALGCSVDTFSDAPQTKNVPAVSGEDEKYKEIISKLDRLTDAQRIKVLGYIEGLICDNEAVEAAKQIKDCGA